MEKICLIKKFKCLRKICKMQKAFNITYEESKKNFEKTLASKSKTSPKPFWSYVKSKLKSRIKVSTLTKSDGTKAYNSREKADALNDFFGSVYKEESDNGPHIDDYSGVPLTANHNSRNGDGKLCSLNPGKSTGPD